MRPARECFEAAHPAADQVNLWLIDQRQLTALDTAAEVAGESESAPQVFLAPGTVARDVAARFTGIFEGRVHVAQQAFGRTIVVRREAQTGVHVQIEAPRQQAEARAQRTDELLGQ